MHQKDLSTSQTFQALPNSSNECLLSHTKTVAMTKENLVHIRMQKSNIEQFVFNTQIYIFSTLCLKKMHQLWQAVVLTSTDSVYLH